MNRERIDTILDSLRHETMGLGFNVLLDLKVEVDRVLLEEIAAAFDREEHP